MCVGCPDPLGASIPPIGLVASQNQMDAMDGLGVPYACLEYWVVMKAGMATHKIKGHEFVLQDAISRHMRQHH